MKYSIVFPGQGSQSIGMLSDLSSNFSIVSEIFQEASDALGVDLWKIAQEDQEALNLTENTQPVMLAAGYATYKVLSNEVKLSPVCMAGHSLGEYTALVASKSLNFFDAVKLVRRRAELMQSAVPKGSGSMAAVLGLDDAKVIEICAQSSSYGVVEAVNFNSPGQVVIAGEKEAVIKACDEMKEAGAAYKSWMTMKKVETIILKHFPVMKEWPKQEVRWSNLMFLESEIIVGTMLELMRQHKAPSLPVHDCIIVRKSDRKLAESTLTKQFQLLTGITPRLKVK